MFSPELMANAQKAMQNMKPEDIQRMSQMMSNMDPTMVERMAKNMGGTPPPGMDYKQLSEQMKRMTPELMTAGLNQMGSQKEYILKGALQLKTEGNNHIKNKEYVKALQCYDRGIQNLRPFVGDDVKAMMLQLLSNAALCHLKDKNFRKAVDVCEEALRVDPKAVKPMLRRGLAHEGLGDLERALVDVESASSTSPEDKSINSELTRLRKLAEDKGINNAFLKEDEPKKAAKPEGPAPAVSPFSSSTGGAPQFSRPGGNAGNSTLPLTSTSAPNIPPGMSDLFQPEDMAAAMEEMVKNPRMVQQMAQMANMKPEDMQKIMKKCQNGYPQAGLQNTMPVSVPDQAKMMGSVMTYMPYALGCAKMFGHCRRAFKWLTSPTMRFIMAGLYPPGLGLPYRSLIALQSGPTAVFRL